MKKTLEMPETAVKKERPEGSPAAWNRFMQDLGKRTYVMGVLNCTPDSFSDGGRFLAADAAFSHALKLAADGADIIDIGGESTRPGSMPVSADEELSRVIPVIRKLHGSLGVPISIDTSKASVAREAIDNGASIINDVTGLRGDREMAHVAAECGVPLIVMHMKGAPRVMQVAPIYKDLFAEITESLKRSIDTARAAGVDENNIIVDPGIGFGKTLAHNLLIIKELYRLKSLGRPIMIGLSRKSFIGEILNRAAEERLMGTASAAAISISNGADILRVHDVRKLKEVSMVADSICRA
ncbi:MAG: dihydropteroate synthase [Candidatus Omnitrophota bacterium]